MVIIATCNLRDNCKAWAGPQLALVSVVLDTLALRVECNAE